MNKKTAVLIYTIVFLILFIAISVYFVSLLVPSLTDSADVVVGNGFIWLIAVFISLLSLLILFVAGFGIYLSVAYFLFYSPKSILKTLWNIGALLFSLILSAGIAYMCIQLQ